MEVGDLGLNESSAKEDAKMKTMLNKLKIRVS